MSFRRQRSPLIFPAISWISGLIVGKFLTIPVTLLFGLSIFLLFITKNRTIRIPAIFLLIAFLGTIRITTDKIYPDFHIYHITNKNPCIVQPIKAKICSEVRKLEDRYRFSLDLIEINEKKTSGRINFSTRQDSLQYGDIIETVAEIRKIRNTTNPSSFDYREYLSAKHIFASGYSKSFINIVGSKSNKYKQVMNSIRNFIRQRIVRRIGDHSGFIQAIAIGDKGDLGSEKNSVMKAGLSHLLAVSGLHVGIIALMFFALLKLLIPNRNISRIILIIILFIYGTVCEWSPSVSRAFIMISIYLLAKIRQSKPDANNILSAAMIITTFINPEQLFSVGFQLSYTAVIVLLNVIPKIRFITLQKDEIEILSFWKKSLNAILILLMSSIFLNIFLTPIILYNFNQLNFNGIIGNVLGIPLISFILPLSFVVIFFPECSFLILYRNSFSALMYIFDKWVDLVSGLPLFNGFVSITFLQMIIIYLALISIIYFLKTRKKLKFLIITICLIFVFFLIGEDSDKNLVVTFFDCGLGDLILIETPGKETVLIDSGPPDSPKSFSNSVLPYLRKKGLSRLDWVMITHAHNDHYGGLETALAELEIKNLILTDEFQKRKIWSKLSERIKREKCRIITISDTTHLNIDRTKLKFLHPDKAFSDYNINNFSIVSRLDFNELSILFTGDLEIEGEQYLLENYPQFLDCDILKVGHHGSKTATSPDFLKMISPNYAFISTSLKNRFNFPHKITLDKLSFLDECLFIAGKDGALQVISDGNSAHFKTFYSNKEFIDDDLE